MILQEDAGFLALNKEPGLPVFPPHKSPSGDSVYRRLLKLRPEQGELDWPEGFAGGILHRLDLHTSGLLVVAKDLNALWEGRRLFSEHCLTKTYRFLSDREVPWDDHRIDRPLAHDKKDRRKMVWQRGRSTPHRGKWLSAETAFHRCAPCGSQDQWEAQMQTGVMHQIRLHAASVGIPILGDRLYGGSLNPDGGTSFFLHHCGMEGWGSDLPWVEPPWSD